MADALTHNLKLIGRYSIQRELRRDRYTAAYVAFDPVLNRELIVKAVQLRPPAGQEATGHDRIDQAFMRQAQAAGRLHHPHIVTVFDAGRLHNIGYLALEKVDGKLLDEAMAEGFRPGFLQAADIAARVADAIEYAHARGVPHGHLSASRIYLQGPERSPKVMGFGGWIDSGATGDFELAGTQAMLPYFQSELSADARRKDLRALGALLYLLLTGTRPDINALRSRRSQESAIIDARPAAPLALVEICDSALELRNLRPFGTAAQMRNALTTWLWGHRGSPNLPNAVTITGTPARLEIAPAAGATMAVPTVEAAPLRERARERRTSTPMRAGGLVLAGLALSAIAVVVVHGRSEADHAAPVSTAAVDLVARAPGSATPALVAPAAVSPAEGRDAAASAVVPSAPTAAAPPARTSAQTTRFGAPEAAKSARTSSTPVQGLVELAVAPWGEVYVNGTARGTTPPLQHLMLPAGRHTIEVRNGLRAPFVAHIVVTPGRSQQISYRFQ